MLSLSSLLDQYYVIGSGFVVIVLGSAEFEVSVACMIAAWAACKMEVDIVVEGAVVDTVGFLHTLAACKRPLHKDYTVAQADIEEAPAVVQALTR